jgi:hypothetical protein
MLARCYGTNTRNVLAPGNTRKARRLQKTECNKQNQQSHESQAKPLLRLQSAPAIRLVPWFVLSTLHCFSKRQDLTKLTSVITRSPTPSLKIHGCSVICTAPDPAITELPTVCPCACSRSWPAKRHRVQTVSSRQTTSREHLVYYIRSNNSAGNMCF